MSKIDVKNGERYGRLTVIREVEKKIFPSGGQLRQFLCKCDCGNQTIVGIFNLRKGVTRSCGCLRKELNKTFIEDCLDKPQQSRVHNIWLAMINRCRNKKGNDFRKYRQKGITVCEEWKDFNTFFEWAINNGYHPSLSIDRIDGNKGYSPDNCRWATAMEQANNIRTNIHLTLNGTTHTIPEWSRLLKVSPRALYLRHYSGWSDKKILTTPVKSKQNKVSNYGQSTENTGRG